MSTPDDVDAAIVGGGPAGLAAAIELRRLGAARVLVLDREEQAGGIPRHAVHTGFGLRDLHRLLSGPAYAARYVAQARAVGVDVRAQTTVTDWSPLAGEEGNAAALAVTGPEGRTEVRARAVILATGCRERPRAARLIAGDRPAGVFTTGALQQFVYLWKLPVGRRAVVVGAEHVSFSGLLTLAHAGAGTVAMVTHHGRDQTYAPLRWITATRLRVPIMTSSRVSRILGRERVEAVEVTDLRNGTRCRLACDTVVFTGDWIGDHELARRAQLDMDPSAPAPRVDAALRTSARGVFAAGNVLHGAEPADISALSGRHAGRRAFAFLESGRWPEVPPVPIRCTAPIAWVSPSAAGADAGRPPLGRMLVRANEFCVRAEIVVEQEGRTLWRQRYRRLVPGRSAHLAADWLMQVKPGGGAVVVQVTEGFGRT
jgi:thioredoxin reductase